MSPALLYLLSCSFLNAVRTRVARLRKPKYAIGALFGCAYFYFYFYRFLLRGDFHPGQHGPMPQVNLGLTSDLTIPFAALVLLGVLIAFAWIFPASRASLTFTEAEVAWLLPGPVTRPQLVRYKLLKSQLGLLLMAVLVTLLTGRVASDGHAWIHALGWWIVFAIIQLHRLGASFALTRLMDRGLSNWMRRVGVLAIAGSFVGLLVVWQRQIPDAPELRDALINGKLGPWLAQAVDVGPARWMLAPLRLVVAPWFAGDTYTFLLALGPALLVLAAHYLWVIHSDVAFEEASVHLSEKRAKLVAARRGGDMRLALGAKRGIAEPIFRLSPTGWAVPAFIWKSFLQAGGRRKARIHAALALVFLLVAAFVKNPLVSAGSSMLGSVVIMMTLLAVPQMTAQSVRQELSSADVFKVAPIRGWQVILGQILGPSLRWAALQSVAVALIFLGTSKLPLPPGAFSIHWFTVLVGIALLLPSFNVTAALIPTAMMLIFPGWWRPGEMRGLEASGMGIVMIFVQIVVLALSLVAPLVVGAAVLFAVKWFAGLDAGIVAGSVAASSVLALEAFLGTFALGLVFDRYDASEER